MLFLCFHMFIWTDIVIIYFISRLQLLTSISEKRFHISFRPFQQRTAAIHLYMSDFVSITYRCHLLPRFPPLLLGATLSTPAFSVAPFRRRHIHVVISIKEGHGAHVGCARLWIRLCISSLRWKLTEKLKLPTIRKNNAIRNNTLATNYEVCNILYIMIQLPSQRTPSQNAASTVQIVSLCSPPILDPSRRKIRQLSSAASW